MYPGTQIIDDRLSFLRCALEEHGVFPRCQAFADVVCQGGFGIAFKTWVGLHEDLFVVGDVVFLGLGHRRHLRLQLFRRCRLGPGQGVVHFTGDAFAFQPISHVVCVRDPAGGAVVDAKGHAICFMLYGTIAGIHVREKPLCAGLLPASGLGPGKGIIDIIPADHFKVVVRLHQVVGGKGIIFPHHILVRLAVGKYVDHLLFVLS